MVDRLSTNPADYIVPLNMNKLEGRMMYLPAPKGKTRDILLISGHHGMLERWWSLAENFNDYGSVTMPDLPGFGGMDSFYKIGKKPDIDAYADYLAAFIKLRFRRKRITLVGVSFGFIVITRMLQLYPELGEKVDTLISIVGFVHKDDLVYKPWFRKTCEYLTRYLMANRPMCFFAQTVFIHEPVVKFIASNLPNSKERRHEITPEEFDATMAFETNLWRVNDMRSHWYTTSEFLNVDNCTVAVDLPVIHVYSKTDRYCRHDVVKEHMQIVFSGYKQYMANGKHHTPNILANKKETGVLLPPGLRRLLNA